uniref:SPFH domain / Band 7 family protein n=1 Tax=Ralstonia solanacearum TaxID=305 RepID=A0A0S4UV83_RALSL
MYEGHPQALRLRATNIIYETTKERGATTLMPASIIGSMNPVSVAFGNAVVPLKPAVAAA